MEREMKHGKSLAAIVLFLLLVVLAASCGASNAPSKSYEAPDLHSDFSKMSWSSAFKAVETKMAKEYAFTQWKGVDWKALYSKYAPQIAKAETSKDFPAYFTALDRFTHSIPDAHVKTVGDDRGTIKAAIGGGYGIIAMKLDNGQIVAAKVIPGSPADKAGIKTGARIVSWGGKAAAAALASTETTFAMPNAFATTEDLTYARLRCMVRSPVGASTAVTVRNPGSSSDLPVTMTAIDDGMEPLNATFPFDLGALTAPSLVESSTLPGNIGYIHVRAEENVPDTAPGDHTPTAVLFKKAVDSFASSGSPGLVLDFRGNLGGSDDMVLQFLNSFYATRTLYEYTNIYNKKSGKMEIWLVSESTGQVEPGKGNYIEPSSKPYTKPVVVLVNVGTVSSGEGVPLTIKRLANGKVMGFWGTNGSFGVAGEEVAMPEGLIVKFPFGQSLDKNKVVQVDSRNMKGGVTPDIRVPMTLDNAVKWANGGDPVLDAAVRYIQEKSNAK